MTKDEALLDLKARVAEFMVDASELAMKKIDNLQASGADIAGDHIRVTESNGPYLVPRDFIAAFALEMRYQYGLVTGRPSDRVRNRRIKNYERMM